jgi:hypothetical protein
MKRMHVHVAVDNPDKAIGYSTMFAARPNVIKAAAPCREGARS